MTNNGANDRVTVAIPVYNGMPHIAQAIDSVLNQTHANIELIVIDDGSTDGTTEFLAGLTDPRITLDPNPVNLGVEGAWNKALDQASRSPYFKLVCADDYLFPNAIATEVATMKANPDVVMVASRRTIVDDNGKTLMSGRGLETLKGKVDGLHALRRSITLGTNILGEPSAVTLRSSALYGLRFDATHKLLIDFSLWTQVLTRGQLFAIKEPLSAFRVGVLSDSLQTVKKHRAMHIGAFKKIAADPTYNVSTPVLYTGIVMATAQTTARAGFYRMLDLRDRFQAKRQHKHAERHQTPAPS